MDPSSTSMNTSTDSRKAGDANHVDVRNNNNNSNSVDSNNVMPPSSPSIRKMIGDQMNSFSALINDNLIVARFGVMASVALLTAYGVSNTPLFFRYHSVAEIPSSYFRRRKTLYGRVMNVTVSDRSIQLNVRHLSPIGMLLPKTWLQTLMRYNPAEIVPSINAGSSKDLVIELAGVRPSTIPAQQYRASQALESFQRDNAFVSLQLMSRRVLIPTDDDANTHVSATPPSSFAVGEAQHDELLVERSVQGQQAICRLRHRQRALQLYPTDVAESLIASGHAIVDEGIATAATSKVVDAAQDVKTKRRDVEYMERLGMMEWEAIKRRKGMWSVPQVRETRKDVLEELEFQKKANVLQRLFRWMRGG